MRVATYTQPSALDRGSLAASALLVMTVLLGTGTLPRVLPFFVPQTAALITPLWLLLYLAAGLGLVMRRGIDWVSWLARYRILLVVLVLGTAASLGWSLVPYLSLERIVHLVGTTIVAVYLGFTVPLLTTLRTVGIVLAALLAASALAAVGMPSLGIESYEGARVWRGVFVSKNALGFWSAIGVLLYVCLGDSVNGFGTRMLCYLMAGVALVTLVFSQSATSLVCLVIGGAAALFMYVAAHFRLGFVRMAAVAVVIGGLAAFAVSSIDTAELVGRSGDLTGRGEVWRQTWNLIMQRPATGFGYGVLWFPAPGDGWIQDSLTDFTWTVHHAHNGFLQVASEVGLPLAVVALLMTVQQLIEIVYCQYQRQQVGTLFVLGFTVAYLVGNYSEARFLVNRELYWILFIALPISMLRQINLVAPSASPHPGAPRGAGPRPFGGPWPAGAGRGAARGAARGAGGAAPGGAFGGGPRVGVAATLPAPGKDAFAAASDPDEDGPDLFDALFGNAFDDAPRARGTPDPGDAAPRGATPRGADSDAGPTGDFDEGEDDFFLDEIDLDATLVSLTLRDVDIDLGAAAAASGSSADGARTAPAPLTIDAVPETPPATRSARAPSARAGSSRPAAPAAPDVGTIARFGSLDALPDGPLKGPINRPAPDDDAAAAERDAQERARDARLGDGLDALFDEPADEPATPRRRGAG